MYIFNHIHNHLLNRVKYQFDVTVHSQSSWVTINDKTELGYQRRVINACNTGHETYYISSYYLYIKSIFYFLYSYGAHTFYGNFIISHVLQYENVPKFQHFMSPIKTLMTSFWVTIHCWKISDLV